MANLPSPISAVVFDCDGLLLDTEICWTRAETTLFARYGFDFGPAEKSKLIGRALEAACGIIAEHFGSPGTEHEIYGELEALVLEELQKGAPPLPGAVELVSSLHGRIPIGVATNSPRRMLDTVLHGAGIAHFFPVTIAADEVEHPKPHPEPYLTVFEKLAADPLQGVTLEDSVTGSAAARGCGAFLITVPSLPGPPIECDYTTTSLADPVLQDWARTVVAL